MKYLFRILFASSFLAIVLNSSAQNTAIEPASRTFPTNWMSRHEQFLSEAHKGDIDIVLVGDSITDGWRWGNGGLAIWNSYYAPRKTADFGIGYDRTQNVLWRMKHGELDGINPRVIVLLIGTNNLGWEDDGKIRNTPTEAAAGVAAVVAELRSRQPKSKIILFGIFPRGEKKDPVRQQVKDANALISKLDDGKSVHFLDIGDKFLSADGELSRDIFPDLLHPNQKGYDIWQSVLQPEIEKILK